MRKRHMLLRRQRILLPYLLRRQPLVSYIVQQHMLAEALGLAEIESSGTEPTVEGTAQRWWPLHADQMITLTSEQVEEVFAPPAPEQAPRPIEPESKAMPSVFRDALLPEQIVQAEDYASVYSEEAASQPGRGQATSGQGKHQEHPEPAEMRQDKTQKQPGFAGLKRGEAQKRSEATGMRRGEYAHITESRAASGPHMPLTLTRGEDGQSGERVSDAAKAPILSSLSAQSASPGEEASKAWETGMEEPPAAQRGKELFVSRGTDRSPQAWLARLNRRAQQTAREARPDPAPRAEQVRRHRSESGSAEPIAQNARAFLKPLLGIDPASVPIYRDAQAEIDTASEQADALSDGETIELAAEHSAQTPATLGLLAHELTHVLRRRNPRFVPPIARVTPGPTRETHDEEALALQVEKQTRRLAQTMPLTSVVRPLEQGGSATSEEAARPDPARPIWGKLPAPWEPLPNWLAAWPEGTDENLQPTTLFPVVSAPPAPALNASEGYSEGPPEIRRAGLERNIEELESASAEVSPVQVEAARVPEPDLDALAQQVYTLLKRRLAVEQRREL